MLTCSEPGLRTQHWGEHFKKTALHISRHVDVYEDHSHSSVSNKKYIAARKRHR